MIERRRGLRFAHEPIQFVLVFAEILIEKLDRYLTIEFRVFGQINLTHPTRPEFRDDAVVSDLGIWLQRLSQYFFPVIKLSLRRREKFLANRGKKCCAEGSEELCVCRGYKHLAPTRANRNAIRIPCALLPTASDLLFHFREPVQHELDVRMASSGSTI